MSCTLPSAPLLLAVGQHPDVGGDAGVVEELLRQGDDGFQPVVLQNPAADFALAAAGIAGEERRAVHDDGHAAAALVRRLHPAEHVLQEEQLPVADARQAGAEAPAYAALGFALDGRPDPSSIPCRRADWRAGNRSAGRRAGRCESVLPNVMFSASRPSALFMYRSDLHTAKVSGLTSWPYRYTSALRVDLGDAVLGDRQHAARAAARVVDGADDVVLAQRSQVRRQQQVHHQADDLARGEVLAGVLVERLVERADQFLEDGAHLVVGDRVGVQVDRLEALHHQEEQPGLVQLGDGVVEVELLQHLAHVVGEAVDVGAQVGGQVGRIGQQPLEGEGRGVVERIAGGLAAVAGPGCRACP